jgi:hypothetical protein
MLLDMRNALMAGGAPLPYDAEVEYLYRQGGFSQIINVPYIDVGILAGVDVGVEVVARDVTQSTTGVDNATMITGSFIASGSGYWGVYNYRGKNYRLWGNAAATIDIDSNTFYTYQSNFINSRKMVIENGGGQVYSGDLTGAPTFSDGNIWLGLINKGSYFQYEAGALYLASAKFSVGSQIVRDMIPVRFTNELGQTEGAMFDKVSGQLFRNQGTGAFSWGNDI